MKSPRILIVEDEGLTAIELQNNLKNGGYNVPSIAVSGEEAITKAIKIKPDLNFNGYNIKGTNNGYRSSKRD